MICDQTGYSLGSALTLVNDRSWNGPRLVSNAELTTKVLVTPYRTSSDFLAEAPEVRVEEVCGGIALSGIDRGKRASADRTDQLGDHLGAASVQFEGVIAPCVSA